MGESLNKMLIACFSMLIFTEMANLMNSYAMADIEIMLDAIVV